MAAANEPRNRYYFIFSLVLILAGLFHDWWVRAHPSIFGAWLQSSEAKLIEAICSCRLVKEDERTDPTNYKRNPGFYFATINYREAQQAFRPWLLEQAHFLEKHLEIYRLLLPGLHFCAGK